MKKLLLLLILLNSFIFFGCKEEQKMDIKEITIIDDMQEEIIVKDEPKRIISLYSAHTQNLYDLGLKDNIVGISTSDEYPKDILDKEKFSYKSDPEDIIAKNPDLVLIRPFINRSKPEFVKILKDANINVVSLYPNNFDEFDSYIEKLGKITFKEEKSKELLEDFHKKIDEFKVFSDNMPQENKKAIYFEASKKNYKTVTNDSMASKAIKLAGGINIASDAKPVKEGSTIGIIDIEDLVSRGDKIDYYLCQKGRMNPSIKKEDVLNRDEFKNIKAIKNKDVYIIDEAIISRPTFRYIEGIEFIKELLYKE